MSVLLAEGCARSRSQGVSVVPMIQNAPHGMTKSTDFSVLVMKPQSERMRSRGTTRWMPLLASTSRVASPPISACTSSVHTPAALMTTLARTSNSTSFSRSSAVAPTTRSPSRRKPVTLHRVAIWAPLLAAVRAIVMTRRASSTWQS